MTTVVPDPKPEPRIRQAGGVLPALLADPECAACGRQAHNAHHVLPKGSPWHGDDVAENGIPLCGSGTTGCHGAEHGSPYVDGDGYRWTVEEVKRAIGLAILGRPKTLLYLERKLGRRRARYFLVRRYRLRVDEVEEVI